MRRAAVVIPLVIAVLWIAAPANAFAHNAVHSTTMHAVLDGLTLLVVTAPVWTAILWGRGRRLLLAGLIALVQAPVAIIGFVPIVHPVVHLILFILALALTGLSLRIVHTRPVPARRADLQAGD